MTDNAAPLPPAFAVWATQKGYRVDILAAEWALLVPVIREEIGTGYVQSDEAAGTLAKMLIEGPQIRQHLAELEAELSQ